MRWEYFKKRCMNIAKRFEHDTGCEMYIDFDESDQHYIVAYVSNPQGFSSKYIFENLKELNDWAKCVIMEG